MYSSAPVMVSRRAVVAVCIVAALTAERAAAEVRCAFGPDGTLHVANVHVGPAAAALAPAVRAPAGLSGGSGDASLLERFGPRAAPYLAEIAAVASRHGLSPALLAAIISVESNFDSRAVSAKGARGLMQVLPSTGQLLGVADLFDVRQNIEAGARHLRGLLERFPDDQSRALAAYNAGEQAVVTHAGIPPFPETRQYVGRVLRMLSGDVEAARAPGLLAVTSAPPPPAPERLYRTVAGDGTVMYSNRSRPSGTVPAAQQQGALESDAVAAAFDASASREACRLVGGRVD